MEFIQVQTTLPTRDDADSLARRLVERQLAACVQVAGPISSTYRWQDAVERAEEWLCLIKTTRAAYSRVETAVREAHPYDVPEIIATEVVAGSAAYLEWLGAAVLAGHD